MTRKMMVAGNWKMNLDRATGPALSARLSGSFPVAGQVDVLVCPPFPYLGLIADSIRGSGVELGAQNCSQESSGALTGEVSPQMLRDFGCQWVILGHSERRILFGETDQTVALKIRQALTAGLQVIVCVGEQLAERQAGLTNQVLDTQMGGSLEGISEADTRRLVVAYEPVWAIGTGLTATPDQAQSAHRHLREWLARRYNPQSADSIRILYGGSVKAQNARALMELPDVDGALVGGASLKFEDFLPIIDAAQAVVGS